MLISENEYCPLPEHIIEEYNLSRNTDDVSNICHSPFKVMFLRIDGKAITCFHNNDYILGDIKQNTLEEIWFGENANHIRDIFNKKGFHAGCKGCVDNLYLKNFNLIIARNYDNLPKADKYPLRIDFNLSNVCNLSCETCNGFLSSYIRKNKEALAPLSTNYNNSEFYEQLKPFLVNLKESFFIGGEPFLIKEYFTIWAMMKDINPNINIIVNTNGTILNDKVKNVLELLSFNLNISIDSLNKENFETIRKNASFEETMENLTYFIDYSKRKNTFLNLTVCPLVKNWQEIPELVKFALNNNIALYFNTVKFPIEHSLFSLSEEKLTVVKEYLKSINIENTSTVAEITKKQLEMLIHQISNYYNNAEMKNLAKKEEKELNKSVLLMLFLENEKNIIANQVKKNEQYLKERQTVISIQIIKLKSYNQEHSQMLLNYMDFLINEINIFIDNCIEYDAEIKENVKECCKAKLKIFIITYQDEPWVNDVIPTIYNNIPVYDIIKSLLSDSEKSLKQGFDKLR